MYYHNDRRPPLPNCERISCHKARDGCRAIGIRRSRDQRVTPHHCADVWLRRRGRGPPAILHVGITIVPRQVRELLHIRTNAICVALQDVEVHMVKLQFFLLQSPDTGHKVAPPNADGTASITRFVTTYTLTIG